jgi:ABC-2 type transport system ATP-binding protein
LLSNGAGKTTFQPLLDLIQPSTENINNGVQVNTSEETLHRIVPRRKFLIGYLTPEEYFYFIITDKTKQMLMLY